MNHLFVPYDITEQLKEKGFDLPSIGLHLKSGKIMTTGGTCLFEPTPAYYKKECAILYQQAIDWFRETHNIHIQVAYRTYTIANDNAYYYTFELGSKNQYWVGKFDTYYSALNSAIKCAITKI